MAIKGYSERGIFNSIAYFLDDNQEFIYDFIGLLGIYLADKNNDYTFLIEQSFSDFGDSDLVIIITNNQTKQKIVVFIEGKVKTYNGKFSIKKEYDEINSALEAGWKNGLSSNLFVQLYYKYLLVNTKGKGNPTDKNIFLKTNKKTKIRDICRKIGDNNIIKNTFKNYVDNANDYYFVTILPEKNIDTTIFQNYIKTLGLMPYEKTRCCWWGSIETFFAKIKAEKVIDAFDFNKDTESQIY